MAVATLLLFGDNRFAVQLNFISTLAVAFSSKPQLPQASSSAVVGKIIYSFYAEETNNKLIGCRHTPQVWEI